MKTLNDKKWDLKIEEIRKEKRDKCGSISADDYNDVDIQGNRLNNNERKKIKEELRAKRRAVKRGQKQEIGKHIRDVLDDIYGE